MSTQFSPFAVPAGYPSGTSKVGQIIGAFDVELAVLQTLAAWLPPYLTQVEIDRGIPVNTLQRPPGPESYRGGVDEMPFQQDETPALIVVAEPTGEPERSASAGYCQMYSVGAHALIVQESEDEARQLASYYGTAVKGAIAQQGSLGGIAQNTRLQQDTTISFPVPDNRQFILATTTFSVWVQPILDDQYAGTFLLTPAGPPWGTWPQVTSESVAVNGPATYATVSVNSAVLTNVSPFPSTILVGTLVFGPGVPGGATVSAFSSGAGTITMSGPAAESFASVAIFLTEPKP